MGRSKSCELDPSDQQLNKVFSPTRLRSFYLDRRVNGCSTVWWMYVTRSHSIHFLLTFVLKSSPFINKERFLYTLFNHIYFQTSGLTVNPPVTLLDTLLIIFNGLVIIFDCKEHRTVHEV